MNVVFRRIIGVTLIATAIIGMLFSAAGLFAVWTTKDDVSSSLENTLNTALSALETTQEGMVIAGGSIAAAIDSMDTLQDTVNATARAIEATTPALDTLVSLSGEDLPNTVDTAQTSLTAAQESARIIDSFLRALSSIPLIGRNIYNPEVPLHIALQQVSESMDEITPALETIEESLSGASSNMVIVQADITLIAADLEGIKTSLQEGQGVVEDYQVLLADLHTRTENAQDRILALVNAAAIILTFLLVWAGISQVGLLLQGAALLQAPDAMLEDDLILVEEDGRVQVFEAD